MQLELLQDEGTSLTTIALSIASCVICTSCAAILFKRAFAEHQFMSNDSAIQYMTHRSRLLFVVAVLNVGEALRNGIQSTYLLVNTQRPNFLVIRLAYAFTFAISLPIQGYATCQRCAVIVTREPAQRQRFLKVTLWIIVVCWIVFEAGLAKYIVLLAAKGSNASDREWFSTSYIDTPVVVFMAVIPLVIMVSTTWALSVNLQCGLPQGKLRRIRVPTTSVVTTASKTATTTTASEGSLSSASDKSFNGTNSHPGKALPSGTSDPVPPSVAPRSQEAPSLFSSLTKAMTSSVSFKGSKSARTASKHSQLIYPLSSTFILLSVSMISLWTLGILAIVTNFLPRTIRSNPLNMFLSSLCVVVEASFETLLRRMAKAHQQREKERQVDKTFALTEAPDGRREDL